MASSHPQQAWETVVYRPARADVRDDWPPDSLVHDSGRISPCAKAIARAGRYTTPKGKVNATRGS